MIIKENEYNCQLFWSAHLVTPVLKYFTSNVHRTWCSYTPLRDYNSSWTAFRAVCSHPSPQKLTPPNKPQTTPITQLHPTTLPPTIIHLRLWHTNTYTQTPTFKIYNCKIFWYICLLFIKKKLFVCLFLSIFVLQNILFKLNIYICLFVCFILLYVYVLEYYCLLLCFKTKSIDITFCVGLLWLIFVMLFFFRILCFKNVFFKNNRFDNKKIYLIFCS